MPKLSEADLQSLRDEIDEMKTVFQWLNKRISQECNEECRKTLMATREYVEHSINCHQCDLMFMSN